jgi:hypothetical protein
MPVKHLMVNGSPGIIYELLKQTSGPEDGGKLVIAVEEVVAKPISLGQAPVITVSIIIVVVIAVVIGLSSSIPQRYPQQCP